jgi:hypothetical protein
MAVIVGLSTVVTQESHGVSFCNVLGVRLHILLGTFPECRDSLYVFVKTEYETVLLLVVGHELKNIIVDVAVQLDAWLDSPVPFVVVHQGLTKEEAGLESTHVTVADGISVDDLLRRHILSNLASPVLVNVFGE